ncbi:sulfotransferase [Sphingosinicellaceae bacterium]|nr:sulfotransferase [Sphingosinicellaceae bacterium]
MRTVDPHRSVLAEAKRLLGLDPRRAADLARPAAAASGGVEARFVLGAALRRAGDLGPSLEILGPLAAALPAVWGVQYEHGMALAGGGRCEAAATALGQAVAINPGSSLALHALGDQLTMLGRGAEAAVLHGRQVAGLAGDPRLAAGVAALFDGDGRAADAVLSGRFGMHLCDLAAVSLIADTGLRLGRFEAVAALLATVLEAAPNFLPARYRRAVALHRADEGEAALAEIAALLVARPSTPACSALRAAIRMQLGDAGGAIEDYAAALASDPNDAQLWHSRGHALRAVGRQSEAVAAYRHAIVLRPGFGEAYWSLANLKTWRFDAGEREAMATLLERGKTAAEDRAYLGFALGKALEDERHYAQAFDHYHDANALRRVAEPYDADAACDYVDHSIGVLDASFFAARAGSGDPAPDPIFVVGMPRSGSTLVEQILASHSSVESASELPDITAIARRLADGGGDYPALLPSLAPADFATLGREYLDRTRVRRRLGRPHFVDKFPGNFLHAGLIHLILPNARIIDVRRDPLACCVSLYKQAFAQGQAYSYDLADLGSAYADYRRLMAHFDAVLPGRIVHVSYEALVKAPEREIRRLLDACGLAFEPGCLRFFETAGVIRTPSSEQVRRPIFRDGLDQWRNFEPWLGPLKVALEWPITTD